MNKVDLKGRDFLKLLDYTAEEITYLVDLAAEYKQKKKDGYPYLQQKNESAWYGPLSIFFLSIIQKKSLFCKKNIFCNLWVWYDRTNEN